MVEISRALSANRHLREEALSPFPDRVTCLLCVENCCCCCYGDMYDHDDVVFVCVCVCDFDCRYK